MTASVINGSASSFFLAAGRVLRKFSKALRGVRITSQYVDDKESDCEWGGKGRGTRANVVLKREEREVKGRVFAAFGTPPELGNISEDSASLLRLFRAPLPLRQHCGYNLVLFIPSRMSKYFQPSPNLPFPLTLLPLSPPSLLLALAGSLARSLFLSVQF